MFQEIRKPLKGNIDKDISEIEQDIGPKLKEFRDHSDKVKKLTAWNWITYLIRILNED